MSERSSPLVPHDRDDAGAATPAGEASTPPLAPQLSAVGASYTWKFGEGVPAPEPAVAGDEAEQLRAQVRHLTAALEDVVALALSGADYKERAIMMHRRAVAALSGARGVRPPGAPPASS